MPLCGRDLTEEEAREIFDEWDKDNSGCVSKQELLDVLLCLAKKLGIDEEECKASTGDIMCKADNLGDGDGKMNFEEFKSLLDI